VTIFHNSTNSLHKKFYQTFNALIQNLMLFLCRFHCEIASGQIQIKRRKKISTSTQQHEMLYTDSKNLLVLSFTVISRYNNCCTDGSSSPGNYGYRIKRRLFDFSVQVSRSSRNRVELPASLQGGETTDRPGYEVVL
jgi:hypothetical protein